MMIKKKTMSLFLTLALVLITVLAIPNTVYATFNAPSDGAVYELRDRVDIEYSNDYISESETTYCKIEVYGPDGAQDLQQSYQLYNKNQITKTSFTPDQLGKYKVHASVYYWSYHFGGIPPRQTSYQAVKEEKTITIEVVKKRATNPLKIKAKTATVKYSKLKKKNQTLAVGKVISFTKKGQGKMIYAKASGNKRITINKNTGKVTIKKKLKKGTYKVKVKVKAAGNSKYKPVTRTVTFKIKVK